MANKENYYQKSQNIFNLLNQFRANPRKLAHHLEKIKKYLDKTTNVLSEPNKVQIQMIEGEKIFDEAIQYLKNLSPLPPLDWDDYLALSAQEHVDDIGPKGLLLYQSSDGTEPEKRICKYGNYIESLGENIDFGPNDEIGVIVSLTLDDGEAGRPHRDNMFKNDFKKIGIACGPHKTEYQMCVMDMAYCFCPIYHNDVLNQNNGNKDKDLYYSINNTINNNLNNNLNNNINNTLNNSLYNSINNNIKNSEINLKQSLFKKNSQFMRKENSKSIKSDNDEILKEIIYIDNENHENNEEKINKKELSEIDLLKKKVKLINLRKKIVKKTVEITTKVTYTYEDGSTKDVNEVRSYVNNILNSI